MKTVFMGTPDFAVPTLRALIESSEHEVVAVYSQPPRPAGRGQKERPSPIHALADAHGIAVHTPTSLKDPVIQAQFRCHGADIAIVAAYGLLLPPAILEAYPRGCINIHPSALPRWRGAAPLQRTLMAGDRSTDICIMQMDVGLDTGDVLLRESIELPEDITTGELHDLAAIKGAELTLQTLAQIDSLTPEPQSEEGITYAAKIDKAEAMIDWSRNAADILNHIRGLNPFPAATAHIHDETVKVFAATIIDHSPNDPFCFTSGDGKTIRITQAQRAGKKRMSTDEILRGWNYA